MFWQPNITNLFLGSIIRSDNQTDVVAESEAKLGGTTCTYMYTVVDATYMYTASIAESVTLVTQTVTIERMVLETPKFATGTQIKDDILQSTCTWIT